MKMQLACLIVAAALFAGCTKTSVEQASQEFNQLPTSVQKAVRSYAPNAEVADVEKHDKNGRLVYEVQFVDKGRNPSVYITPEGTIVRDIEFNANMGRDAEIKGTVSGSGSRNELSALPTGVQEAIRKHTPLADVSSIDRKEYNGRMVYVIEFAGKEKKPALHVADDGTVVQDVK